MRIILALILALVASPVFGQTFYRWGEVVPTGGALPSMPCTPGDLFYLTSGVQGTYTCDSTGVWRIYDSVTPPKPPINIQSLADFPAPVAGVITLAADTTYQISGEVDLGTNRIVWGARSGIVGTNRVNDRLVYTGTGTMFTIASGAVVGFFQEIGLRAPNGTLLDLSGASGALIDVAFGTIGTGGTIALSNSFSFSIRASSMVNAFTTTGFTFTGTSTSALRIFDNLARGNVGTMFNLGTSIFTVIDIGRNVVDTSVGQTFVSGTTGGANVTAAGILVSNAFTGAGTGVSTITATDTNWFFGSNTGVTDSIEPVVQTALNAKQATLVSATNIKTINGLSVLGSGDLVVSGSGAAWGSITGTLSAQTDLQTALDGKQASGSYATGTGSANGTNTGDQTSIVGITGSLAEFNTALTGADFATGGGTASGTNTGDQTSVTGNAGTATTLQTPRTINGVSFNGSANIVTPNGYTLSVQALTSSPADGATIYFGQLPKAPVTAQGNSRIYIRKAGTIKTANVFSYSGTAGTAEAWVCNVRLNNSGDTQIASIAAATNERTWSNTGLSIAVVVGDYVEIKCVNPTWATNPLTSIFGGYLYIE